ncbi:hypothetical protein AALO_G00112880 [Alosa alosa]|uniref:Thromboxane A2 receptor n=1 Tax=Alosa alosa TaxID=278164 RepID=A0AAV6GQC0_9TELE|nr:prostaglandin E receptor 2b subtype EP2 [Alosa alosa]KAG5277045.1 hypothetical protein AALO_G00112880 [Alosa alosa]
MERSNASDTHCKFLGPDNPGTPAVSASMFAAGVLGNIFALFLLEIRRWRKSRSLFHVLVTALVITDLLGTLAVSPVVLAAYVRKASLEMMGGRPLCNHFGFSMTFFSLATLSILLAMAVERWLSIGHAYFYERYITKRCGYFTIPLIYLVCFAFCTLPFAGVGKYLLYCPGTWCFFDMHPKERRGQIYAGLYASAMLVMILCTVFCNGSVGYHLFGMYRRRKHNRGSFRGPRGRKRYESITKEVEHLVLLVVMTVCFLFFSLPLVIQVYTNFFRTETSHKKDLQMLRLLSFNSIVDPWVFIILSPSVLRFLWGKLCRRQQQPLVSVERTIHTTRPIRLDTPADGHKLPAQTPVALCP